MKKQSSLLFRILILVFIWSFGFSISNLLAKPTFAANSGQFTLSLWVNPTTSVSSKALISKAEEFRIFTNASGYVGCQIKTTTWQTASQSTTKALVLGSWSNVICTYDLTSLKVYVNGVLTAQTSLTSLPDDTTAVLRLGQDDSSGTTYTNLAGVIDEFKFYNYALSVDEVKVEYNRGSALIMGYLSNTSALTGGSSASDSASASYCVPGDSAGCAAPVAEWNFENDVKDNSGNANDGTWSGSSTQRYSSGKIGKAGKFNGSDDYVTTNDMSSVEGLTSLTVSAWIKPNAWNNNDFVVEKGSVFALGKSTYIGANGGFMIFENGTSTWKKVQLASTPSLGVWHHIVGVYNGQNLLVYLDGSLSATGDAYTGVTRNEVYVVNIGGRGTTFPFDGLIDQVRIFNYARTPAQIAWDYNNGKPVAWWKFNECSGTTLHSSNDPLTSSNNGTLTGGTPGTCTDGTGTTLWNLGASGKYNSGLYFNGSSFVSVPASLSTNSVAFWIKPTTNTASMINLNATAYITAASGVISVGAGFSSPTYYINGKQTTSPILTANVWNHIVVTTATSITANAITIAKANSAYTTGQMDDVRLYNYPLTATQVKTLYNEGSAVRFGP